MASDRRRGCSGSIAIPIFTSCKWRALAIAYRRKSSADCDGAKLVVARASAAVCSGFHDPDGPYGAFETTALLIEQRLARWLAMCHDRARTANELPLTHEFLGIMIGVRRASVTGSDPDSGEQENHSPHDAAAIEVLDRAKLEVVGGRELRRAGSRISSDHRTSVDATVWFSVPTRFPAPPCRALRTGFSAAPRPSSLFRPRVRPT